MFKIISSICYYMEYLSDLKLYNIFTVFINRVPDVVVWGIGCVEDVSVILILANKDKSYDSKDIQN